MKKVYCSNCNFYDNNGVSLDPRCRTKPETIVIPGSWLSPEHEIKVPARCSERNKDNDCPYWVARD